MEALKPLQAILEDLNARLKTVEALVGSEGVKAGATTSLSSPVAVVDQEVEPSIEAYDEYTRTYLVPFMEAAKKLGSQMVTLSTIVEKAFAEQRSFLLIATKCKKPAAADLMPLLSEIQGHIKAMSQARDNRSEFSNHQNMLNEGLQSLGWLCVEPAPKPFIESYVGGADFWGNKIRVQYKTSNPDQVNFVTTFKALLTELMAYVKAYHTTGVIWNSKGIATSDYKRGTAVSSSVETTASATTLKAPSSSTPVGGVTALFAGIKSIDQSSGKTAGLKTVTKEMQTWRKEYKGGDQKIPSTASVAKKPEQKAPVEKLKKPPVCENRNGNWFVENQGAGDPVTVTELNMKQQVYVFNCVGATIILEGKCKNIVFDSCKNSKLLFDNAVSSIEIVNCKSVQVQCKGKVPSVAIDKTDGCLVYVSSEGMDTHFVTSKSSEMNVSFPAFPGSDEYVETPIPEQFVHKIRPDQKMSSEVSELYS